MRILYIDIDSLRPDHLGCYGYHRETSPNIDRIASEGVCLTNCYASDVPCMPSRFSLFSGRFGIHTGVVNHCGVAADPFIEGVERGFMSTHGRECWMMRLREAGYKTASVSSFGERHSAWHWYAGFSEIFNTGQFGMEEAGVMSPVALDWIERNGSDDNWFLHVNLWDPHTPYRTPDELGNRFADDPIPEWLTEEVRRDHWNGLGAQCARERDSFSGDTNYSDPWPRQPGLIDSMEKVREMFDGYDMGVWYADQAIGRILDKLESLGVLDDTAIIISADHGENLGELNIYGCHQLADNLTARVPCVFRWPGVTNSELAGSHLSSLHYHMDWAATVLELAGGEIPEGWDARSFKKSLLDKKDSGRDYLIISQLAASCQRAVRFGDYLCIRNYHDGYRAMGDFLLYDVVNDPHEQSDLSEKRPDLLGEAMVMLERWHGEMMKTATNPQDPVWTVFHEGGPFHSRGQLPNYLKRLRATERGHLADKLEKLYPGEC